jgi:hypothetical protein
MEEMQKELPVIARFEVQGQSWQPKKGVQQ